MCLELTKLVALIDLKGVGCGSNVKVHYGNSRKHLFVPEQTQSPAQRP